MGFRSMFVTTCKRWKVPAWFEEKYPWIVVLGESKTFPIVSKWETKFYDNFHETPLFIDLQKVLSEQPSEPFEPNVEAVLLHECGGVTLIHISPSKITGAEAFGPDLWTRVNEVNHNYCYNCSGLE